jgi:hypothetical protein
MSRTVKPLVFTKKWVSNGRAALRWMDREDHIHSFTWSTSASKCLLVAADLCPMRAKDGSAIALARDAGQSIPDIVRYAVRYS